MIKKSMYILDNPTPLQIREQFVETVISGLVKPVEGKYKRVCENSGCADTLKNVAVSSTEQLILKLKINADEIKNL